MSEKISTTYICQNLWHIYVGQKLNDIYMSDFMTYICWQKFKRHMYVQTYDIYMLDKHYLSHRRCISWLQMYLDTWSALHGKQWNHPMQRVCTFQGIISSQIQSIFIWMRCSIKFFYSIHLINSEPSHPFDVSIATIIVSPVCSIWVVSCCFQSHTAFVVTKWRRVCLLKSVIRSGDMARRCRGRLSIGNLQGHTPWVLDCVPSRATSRPTA